MSAKRLQKTTKEQYEELLNFVIENKFLLTGKTKPLEANKINLLWQKFAQQMNANAVGPQKTAEQCRKIFSEWKVNVRRKSRTIAVNRMGTGGGPHVNKFLTGLEERLLIVISKIHLGDTELKDTFSLTEVSDQLDQPIESELEEIIIVDSFAPGSTEGNVANDELETLMIMPEIDKQQAGPSKEVIKGNEKDFTPTKRNSSALDHTYTARQQVQKSSRYTSSLLQSACEAYKEGTQLGVELKKCKQENLLKLALSIEDISKAIAENTAALQARTSIEKAKLKLEYFKLFGNFENFEHFCYNKE